MWDRALEEATGEGYVIAFLDLDGLKALNDRQGHDAGDMMIARAGRTLAEHIRTGDVAARYGSGDEYVAMLSDMDEPGMRAWERRLRDAYATAGISISVGVVRQAEGEALEATVKRADKAMYGDKERRKATEREAPPVAQAERRAPPEVPAAGLVTEGGRRRGGWFQRKESGPER
jgi:diguanylate cyclase (GGDEF)-like protein